MHITDQAIDSCGKPNAPGDQKKPLKELGAAGPDRRGRSSFCPYGFPGMNRGGRSRFLGLQKLRQRDPQFRRQNREDLNIGISPARFPKLKTLQQSHADFCSTEGAIQLLFFAEESPEPFQFPCSACSPRHSKDMESCTAPYHSL